LAEYERLKESLDGKSFKQYQENKYGFYHLLLDSKKIHQALVFLTKSFAATGHNSKPVSFHSIKMAINLSNLGYGEDVVIISILHDLIEDTEVKYVDIKEKFGKKIADTVLALSFDPGINDRKKRDKKEIDNAIQFGKDAAIVKAADFIDNSNFYHLTDKKLQQYLIKKYKYFLENSKQIIGNEKIYYLLKKRFEDLKHD
jgi:(p)ppGpp synthase/HD superfamily hydrolase